MIITKQKENGYENIEEINRIENIKDGSVIVSFSNNNSDIEIDIEDILVIRE
jgi:hypothetical protein